MDTLIAYTTRQAGEELGLSKDRVLDLCSDGILSYEVFGGRFVISGESVLRLKREREAQPVKRGPKSGSGKSHEQP